MEVQSYRDLRVWQIGLDLVCQTYRLTQHFPKFETYGLASQVQRAAVSVPSNIAEGHARGSRREFLHFITIAIGSLAELETQLMIAIQLNYLTAAITDPVLSSCQNLGRLLRALQQSLKAKS